MSQNNHNSKTKSLLTGVLIFAIGIILLICNKEIKAGGIITLAGILFLLTGIINIILYVTQRDEQGNKVNRGLGLIFGWLVSIASIVLGACMFFFKTDFVNMIPVIFGIIIFFGVFTLAFSFLVRMRKVLSAYGWMWIFPLLMTIAGIITFTQKASTTDTQNDSLIMIMTGSSFLLYGIANILVGILASTARRNAAQAQSQTTDVQAVDVSKQIEK